jgi:hypothetical protein
LTPETNAPKDGELTAADRAERRRRLAEVFGDALPEQTSDDISPEGGDVAATEEWLRRQVPPHHG